MKKIGVLFILMGLVAGYAFGQGYDSSDQFGIAGSSSSYPSQILESLYGRSDYFSTDTRTIPSIPDSVAYQYEPVEFFTNPIFQYQDAAAGSSNIPYYLSAKGVTYPATNAGSVYDPGFIDAAQSAASGFQTPINPFPAPTYQPPSTPYD